MASGRFRGPTLNQFLIFCADFQKAAAFIHEFLLKLGPDTDCAELRDSLNLSLLHMQVVAAVPCLIGGLTLTLHTNVSENLLQRFRSFYWSDSLPLIFTDSCQPCMLLIRNRLVNYDSYVFVVPVGESSKLIWRGKSK